MIPAITEVNFPSYATLHQATVSLTDMGDRVITTQVKIDGDVVPDFSGWELSFKGERFVLPSKDPQASKDNTTRNSLVDLQFVSWPVQELKRYYFFSVVSTAAGTIMPDQYKVPVRLTLPDFVALCNDVLAYYFGGKIVMSLYPGTTYATEPSVVEIDYSYLWDVIGKIFEIYGARWIIKYNSTTDVYTISVGESPTPITDHDFEYGYQGGLLKFERQVQDENITNILLGRGGEKNLPYRYFKLSEGLDGEVPASQASIDAHRYWAGDPDAIPELASIGFDRLHDINFRWYVRGWMHNPNRDTSGDAAWDAGHVFPTYTITSDSPYYWAYQKGLTDESFDPVEYVKDDASIAQYGEHWGALDDNDDIYPSIQGRYRSGLGRIDEVVAVSQIITDDISAMAATAAIEQSIARMVVSSPSTNPYTIESDWFEVPTGQTGNITYSWVEAKGEGGVVHVDTTQSTLVAIDANGTSHPISGLTAGRYRLRLTLKLYVPSGFSTVGTWGVENIVLTTSAQDSEFWKPTFDIWVKNIWGTTKSPSETPAQYSERVWREILGDRVGNEAKVVFSTGFMSISEDYEFVIADYPAFDQSKEIVTTDEHGNTITVQSEWRITLRKCDAEYDATGLYIPNATTGGKPIAGDKFFFIGIDMPFMYVTLAEEDLNQYKTANLEPLSTINPTWVITLDKVRVHTLEAGEYEQTLADRLASGAQLRVTDPRFSGGDVLTLYAQSITYTWNEPTDDAPYIVPDIEIVLSDKVVSRESRLDKVEGSIEHIRSQYARIDEVEAVVRKVAEPIFLKKTGEADSSASPTQFASKVSSKGFRQGAVGGAGWGFYRDNTAEVAEGEDGEGDAVLEVDRMVVRKEMQVNSLVVNQVEYRGGMEIISAAKIEISKVVETPTSYICYFDQRQNSVANNFVVDDIAYGHVFTPTDNTLRYYKCKVTAVDVDRVELSKTVKDGAGVPQEGDVIVQYGNYTNTARQYVIVRDVIGGGYERMLFGLNSVSSTGTEYYFAGRQTSTGDRWFVGNKSTNKYAEWLNGELTISGRLAVTSTVDKGDGSYIGLSAYLNALQNQIDGNIQSWASGQAPSAQTEPLPKIDDQGQVDPTTANYPASDWTTDTLREKHVGDIYVDDTTGQGYRYTKRTNNGATEYYWVRITDEELAQALADIAQLKTDVAGLDYLVEATNEGTLISGGLVLTSLIQLGKTENEQFQVWAGINGLRNTSKYGNGIAAWYGGPMADKDETPTPQTYAKSLFRFDGSGYLAGGNIYWNESGYGGIPGITWSRVNNQDVVTIGANVMLEQTGGTDSTVTDLITLVRQVGNMFVEETYTEGGQTKKRLKLNTIYTGLYTDGFLAAGGIGSGGGGGGGGSAVSWGEPTGQYTPLTVDGDTRYLSVKDHTHTASQITDFTAAVQAIIGTSVSLDEYFASLQSQIDSVSSRNTFDELLATAIFGDQITASAAYFGSLAVSNTDLVPNLNADLLDGQHGSYYNNLLAYYDSSATSANDLTYPLALTANGGPNSLFWYITSMYYSSVGSNNAFQIACSYNMAYPSMCIRQKSQGTFTNWEIVYTTANANKGTIPWAASTLTLSTLLTFSGEQTESSTVNPFEKGLEYDSTAHAWHLRGNFYADGWIAAGGVGSGGGGGGGTAVSWGTEVANTSRVLTVDGEPETLSLFGHKHDTSDINDFSTAVDALVSGNYLPLTGGTLSGTLFLGSSTSTNEVLLEINRTYSSVRNRMQMFLDPSNSMAAINYHKFSSTEIDNTLYIGNGLLTFHDGTATRTVYHSGNLSPFLWSETISLAGDIPYNVAGYGHTANSWPTVGGALSVGANKYYGFAMQVDAYDRGEPYLAVFTSGTLGSWHRLAYTTSNVASATKLQTARTLWGQSFDGTANVSGAMSSVGNISMSGSITGLTAINTTNLAFGTNSITTDCSITPTTNNERNLGASDKRWNYVYGTNGDFTNISLNGSDVGTTLSTLTGKFDSSGRLYFDNLPTLYWANVAVSETGNDQTTPSFRSLIVGFTGNQYVITGGNNGTYLSIASTTGGRYPQISELARLYKTGVWASTKQSLLPALSDTSGSGFDNVLEYDSTNHAFRLKGNLYADGWIAAGGLGSGSGGGTSVAWGTEVTDTSVVLTVDGTPKTLSLFGHKHTSANITDLSSAVGTIIGSTIFWGTATAQYTPLTIGDSSIATNTRNLSVDGHKHQSTDITDFTTAVQNIIGTSTTLDSYFASLQSQIDSISSRNTFDEINASVLNSDIVTANSGAFTSVSLNGSDLATTLGGYLPLTGGTLSGTLFLGSSTSTGEYLLEINRTYSSVRNRLQFFLDPSNNRAAINYHQFGTTAIDNTLYIGNNLLQFRDGTAVQTIWHTGNLNPVSFNSSIDLTGDIPYNEYGYGTSAGGWQTVGGAFAVGANKNYGFVMQVDAYDRYEPYLAVNKSGVLQPWHQLAYLTSNVASATKLKTARTIWGQSFDGTANVTGAMSGVTNINSLLYFTSSNVGIGNSSPSYKLDVTGTLHATGATTLGSTLNVAQTVNIGSAPGTLPSYLTGKVLRVWDGGLYVDDSSYIVGSLTLSNGLKSVTLSISQDGRLEVDGDMYATGAITAGDTN